MEEVKQIQVLSDDEIYIKLNEIVPANFMKGFVPAYKYPIFLNNTEEQIGIIDLRIGFNEGIYYGGNIGYTIFEQYRGSNFALKACLLIKQVATSFDMDKVYITCNPDNIGSRKTCEKLGLHLVEIADLPPHNDMYIDGERQKCIFEWTLSDEILII
jgi:predicted acetyltransferase